MTFGNWHGTPMLHKYTGVWRYTLDNAMSICGCWTGHRLRHRVLRITDEEGASVTKTVRIRITGENDAPRLFATVGETDTVVARDEGVLEEGDQTR